jgi:hypothetical protein
MQLNILRLRANLQSLLDSMVPPHFGCRNGCRTGPHSLRRRTLRRQLPAAVSSCCPSGPQMALRPGRASRGRPRVLRVPGRSPGVAVLHPAAPAIAAAEAAAAAAAAEGPVVDEAAMVEAAYSAMTDGRVGSSDIPAAEGEGDAAGRDHDTKMECDGCDGCDGAMIGCDGCDGCNRRL